MTREKFIDLVEELDWNVSVDETDEGLDIELENWSSYGQDLLVPISCKKDFSDFLDNLYEYYENYDVSYETILWVDPLTGHGRNGAPYELKDILADMESCENMIEELHTSLTGKWDK